MKAQKDDTNLSIIIEALEQKTKPKFEDIAHTSHEVKAFLAQWNCI